VPECPETHEIVSEKRPSDLHGHTVVEDCQDCDYWRARWVKQQTLADVGDK